LKTPARELISAASRPATTMPRSPAGITLCTSNGYAPCAASATALPEASTMVSRPGARPVRARATAIMPGTMKMNTGRSLSSAAKVVPRRASRSLGALSVRCTMYWSVHQYHRPMIGAQKSMPSHG
jgi:hypothetical protein